jgi:hypothetical protein
MWKIRMAPLHPQTTLNNPSQSTADQRLNEVAGLLAAGILRLRQRNLADSGKTGKTMEKPLDGGARQSVHASRT